MGLGAAIASFFLPGLGQGFKGELGRAFKIFGISVLLGIVQSFGFLATQNAGVTPNLVIALLISIPGMLFYFAQVLDAYGSYKLPV